MSITNKPVAEKIFETVKERIESNGNSPRLALVRANDDIGTLSYEKSIVNKLIPLGIEVVSNVLDNDISNEAFLEKIKELNKDDSIDAILIFKPLPSQIDTDAVDLIINPDKDPDGLSPVNLGKLVIDSDGIVPATAQGIIELLDYYDIDVKGKNVTVINNSAVIGKPLTLLFTNRFATVSLCHEFTKNLEDYTKDADIIITAAGVPDLIKPDMVGKDTIIIDAGVASKEVDGKRIRVGDLSEEFEDGDICSITNGLGGGVGPITTAVLAQNVLKCSEK